MPRYVARPRAGIVDDPDVGMAATATEIFQVDDDWLDSGLLDASGYPLYRERERIRLGFTAPTC